MKKRIIGCLLFIGGCLDLDALQIPLTLNANDIKYCPTTTTNPKKIKLTGTGFSIKTQIFVGGQEAKIIPSANPADDTLLEFYCPQNIGAQGKKLTIQAKSGEQIAELKDAITYYLDQVKFTTSQTALILTGDRPTQIVVGDFDPVSKKLDLAVSYADSNPPANKVDILLNTGLESFTPDLPLQITIGGGPHPQIVAGDFNQDQRMDLLIMDRMGTNVFVATQMNNTFSNLTIPIGQTVRDISVGDFNNDGYVDFATINDDSLNLNRLSIVMNNSKATGMTNFNGALKYTLPNNPDFLSIQDFDKNGFVDIMAVSKMTSSVSLFNNINGNIVGVPTTFSLENQFTPLFVTLANIVPSDLPNFITIGNTSSGKKIGVYSKDGSTYKLSTSTPYVGDNPLNTLNKAFVLDLDKDGFEDILFNHEDKISVFINKTRENTDGTISFFPPMITSVPIPGASFLQSIASMDINEDGLMDFVGIPNQGSFVVIIKNLTK